VYLSEELTIKQTEKIHTTSTDSVLDGWEGLLKVTDSVLDRWEGLLKVTDSVLDRWEGLLKVADSVLVNTKSNVSYI
jgi:hypothetical protein